jgi:cellobiose-specific phosphotransferase system component IIC
MTKTKEFIQVQLKNLNNGFVATPETRDNLEAFARANNGSMDIVLMQMAIQYGYKLALETVLETMPE